MFINMAALIVSLVLTADADATTDKKEMKPKEKVPEQAKRLGIEKPSKTMRFETVKSKRFAPEEYDIVIDEEEAKKAGFKPKEIRKTLIEAMDSRQDRREDGCIELELQDDFPPDDAKAKKGEYKGRLVGKIKKTKKPENAHQAGKPAEKKVNLFDDQILKINTQGACEQQNRALLEAVKFDPT